MDRMTDVRTIARSSATATLGLLLAAWMVGCGGFEGNQGNLRFEYQSDEFSSSQSLAVGSRARLRTFVRSTVGSTGPDAGQNGSSSPETLDLTNVTSSAPSIIGVDQVGQPASHIFQLNAKKAGSATLTVEGTDASGSTVSDAIDLQAKAVKQVELDHTCLNINNPVYLTDNTTSISMNFKSAAGDRLVGWGHYPVTLSPTGSGAQLVQMTENSGFLALKTGSKAQTLTVKPKVNGKSLSLELAEEKAIDDFSWYNDSSTPALLGDPAEPDGALLIPQFGVGQKTVCRSTVDLKIDNKTTGVCEVTAEDLPVQGDLIKELTPSRTVIRVKEKQEKSCKFDVTVANASTTLKKSVDIDLANN
jgi:hypothetical protein